MSDKISVPPFGRGNPPPNLIAYVAAPDGTYVKWQTDAQGWAIGYELCQITPATHSWGVPK